MKKKELLKQLNNLKKTVKPDLDWQESNRDILLSQINAQTRLNFETAKFKLLPNIFQRRFLMPVLKPVASLVLIVVFVFGVWTASVSATKKSLPGDLFYNIKLTTERVQVNLTLNDEKKANLEIAFAQRRLEEIEKIVEKSEPDSGENIEIPLKKFQENMNNVKSNLAKLEIKDKEGAIKIANLIDEKSKEYVGLLMDQQGKLPGLALNTAEAISASKSTANKALSLIIEEYETGDSDLSAEEVVSKVQTRIDSLQTALNSAKTDIDVITDAQAAEAIRLAEEAAKAEEEARLAEEEAAKLAEEEKSEEELATDQSAEEASSEEADSVEETPAEDSDQDAEAADQSDGEAESQEPVQDQPADQSAESVPTEETPVEITNEEPVEPVEVLPTIEEIKDMRVEALALLVDAENLLKENQVRQAFDKVKQADDLLSLINKVILANSQYLPVEEAAEQDSSADAEADSRADDPEAKNSAAQISVEGQ